MSTQTLREWQQDNWPDRQKWRYASAAQEQIGWIRNRFAYMIWNTLLPDPKGWTVEKREATLTVDGTHTSKSIVLPVYRFDVAGVTLKCRGNFHDWCVRCWTPMKKEFPEWMRVHNCKGFFEGMDHDESPVSFCVENQEQLYTASWWMLNEAIKGESK